MYKEGKGTAQEYQEAIKWIRLSAEQGYANAQCSLGGMYLLQDHNEEYKW